MNKKIISIILATTLILGSVPVFAETIDWTKINIDTPRKEIIQLAQKITPEEALNEMLRNDTYNIDGKNLFDITNVWEIEKKPDADCIYYNSDKSSKITLLCPVDKVSVSRYEWEGSKTTYLAPDGYDSSYAKDGIDNLPAGTTFTLTHDGTSSIIYRISLNFKVPNSRYGKTYASHVRFYPHENAAQYLESAYYDYALEKYEKIKSAPASLKDAKEAYSHRYREINYSAGNGDYLTTANGPVSTTSANQTVDNMKEMKEYAAYNIAGNNYFKLRDICWNLTYAGYFIDVTWDGANNAINLITGQKYTEVGGENQPGDGKTYEAVPCNSKICLNGKEIKLTAYTIGGNNYFKLRDLCRVLNIFITWDSKVGCIVIEPNRSYVEN